MVRGRHLASAVLWPNRSEQVHPEQKVVVAPSNPCEPSCIGLAGMPLAQLAAARSQRRRMRQTELPYRADRVGVLDQAMARRLRVVAWTSLEVRALPERRRVFRKLP